MVGSGLVQLVLEVVMVVVEMNKLPKINKLPKMNLLLILVPKCTRPPCLQSVTCLFISFQPDSVHRLKLSASETFTASLDVQGATSQTFNAKRGEGDSATFQIQLRNF